MTQPQQDTKILDQILKEIQTMKQVMVTKDDLKKSLDAAKKELLYEIKKLDIALTLSVDNNKVDRKEFEALDNRVTKIEQN